MTSLYGAMSAKNEEWKEFIDKKVFGSNNKEVGKIKEKSGNYIRMERGLFGKDSFWIPEYLFEYGTGGKPKLYNNNKELRLLVNEAEVRDRYEYSDKPMTNQYKSESELFLKQSQGTIDTSVTAAGIQKGTIDTSVTAAGSPNDPIQILKLRFAKGEITKKEYEDILKIIQS